MNKLIHQVKVIGRDIDSNTRCSHYHGATDIIAIKFKCCEDWFPCYECHRENTEHQPEVWARNEFDTPAILCGYCGQQLTVHEYLTCQSTCPNCRHAFNPGCANHYQLYFERRL